MHIRPYIDLPEPSEERQAPPDLAPFARCGNGETAEMPVIPGASGPPDGRQERSRGADRRTGSGGSPGRGAAGNPVPRNGAPPGVHEEDGRTDRRERRRPVAAALAAAGVVTALGAGLLVTQSLGDDGDERTLSVDDRELPGMPSGAPTHGMPSKERGPERSASPSATPSRTVEPTTPRADRGTEGHAGSPSAKSSASPSEPAGGSGSASSSSASAGPGGASASGSPSGGKPEQSPDRPARPAGETLRAGDQGSRVTELQRRLKQAGYLAPDAPEDGAYSPAVQDAVSRYQADRGVQGDARGEYGPGTRSSLESHTTG